MLFFLSLLVTQKIHASELIITKDGQPRIAMGTNEKDGGVGMAFLDSKGVARVAMGTDVKGDGGIAVLDAKEATRILMGSGAEGTGIMVIGGGVTELGACKSELLGAGCDGVVGCDEC